jgi:uncharacterized protein
MPENAHRTSAPARADRKLGDEWEDWDGTSLADRTEAPAWIYVVLSGGVALLLALAGAAGTWLVTPRLDDLGVRWLGLGLLAGWSGYLVVWYLSLALGLAGVRVCRRLLRRLGGLTWTVGAAVALGRLAGLSRDRVGHAFVLVHNRLEVLPPLVSDPARLLVLVPRCLSRETLQGLAALKDRYGFTQLTATGGTEARRAIAQQRPEGLVAVACERDLLSGVHDLKGRVPVLAFPNLRPEGPCKNTVADLRRVEEAVRLFLGSRVAEQAV